MTSLASFTGPLKWLAAILVLAGCSGKDNGSSGGDVSIETDTAINSGKQPGKSKHKGKKDDGLVEVGDDDSDDSNDDGVTCASDEKVEDGACIERDLTEMENRDDCFTHGGFWYDAADVAQTEAGGFAALNSSCHESHRDGCPDSGTVNVAKKNDDSLIASAVDVDEIGLYDSHVVELYSTIRCVHGAADTLALSMSANDLATLDLSVQPGIVRVLAANNANLTHIDFPAGSERLTDIDLSYTQVPGAEFDTIDTLVAVTYYGFGEATLDVSGLPNLATLSVGSSALTSLDLSSNYNLDTLDISSTGLEFANIGIGDLPNLDVLVALNNGITSLADMPVSTRQAFIDGADLPTLDLGSFANLEMFTCVSCNITTVNLVGAAALESLTLGSNHITSMGDLSQSPALNYLMVHDNLLSSLDLSHLEQLDYLNVGNNQFASLDLSGNPHLRDLFAHDNVLTALDVTQNPALHIVELAHNNLTYGGVNPKWDLHEQGSLFFFSITDNPNLILDFERDVTVHSDFVDSGNVWLLTEEAAWDTYTGPDKPAWTYNATYGAFRP